MLRPELDPFFKAMKKERQSGRERNHKIKIGTNASAGPDAEDQFTLSRSQVGTGQSVSFTKKWNDTHAWMFVNEKVVAQSAMAGGIYQEVDEKVEETKQIMNLSILRDLWGASTGVIGQVSSADTAVKRVIFTAPVSLINNLRRGMWIELSTGTTAATKIVYKSGATASITTTPVQVDQVDVFSRKFSVVSPLATASANATGMYVANANTTVINDATAGKLYVSFVGGLGASRTKGIYAFLPSSISSTDSFFGVNRSLAPSDLAGYYKSVDFDVDATGADYLETVWDNLSDCITKTFLSPSKVHKTNKQCTIFANFDTLQRLTTSKFFKDAVRFNDNTQRMGAKIGFDSTSLIVTAGGRDYPVMGSNYVLNGEFIGADPTEWKWSYLAPRDSEFISFAKDSKGGFLHLDEKSNLYKARMYNYNFLFPDDPSNCFRLVVNDT